MQLNFDVIHSFKNIFGLNNYIYYEYRAQGTAD